MNQYRQKRLNKGLTQEAVAEYLEMGDKSTISKWENGVSSPRTDILPKIATLYNCTVDELLASSAKICSPTA